MTTRTPLTARIVSASARHPWVTILLALVLAAAAGLYASRNFAMTTDTAELISPELDWRRGELDFDAAFPQQQDLIVAVVDGATPELAEQAAARLSERLQAEPGLFRSVRRPEGGPFFARNGLLLLPPDEVQSTLDQLIAAQPFLGPLAADPSLRGIMGALGTVLEGVNRGQARLAQVERPLAKLGDAFTAVLEGRPAFFSWQALVSGDQPGPRQTRRFILVQPVMDYSALQPGKAASDALRAAARALALDPAHGVTVRLTGPVPMADEEFASLADRAEIMASAMLLALVAMLWLAVRSARLVAAILATALLGLVVTAGLGLLVAGRFNLISVAFIPLFLGLGVDFGIQLCVRFRAERLRHPGLREALGAAGGAVGGSLALAAVATAVGFLAFLPTSYLGVSELGAIAGAGMIVAFLLSITLLPALVAVLRPRGERAEVGWKALAPLDAWLRRRRRAVIAGGAALGLIALALMPLLRFDFNPLHLRSAEAESMATLHDLMQDPDRTPNTIDVLAPSLPEAESLAARLARLPEVSQVVTLGSFIPADQEAKLAAVHDAADLLSLTLDPLTVRPPPTDAEVARSMADTAAALRQAAGEAAEEPAQAARRLAGALAQLAAGPPAPRAAAEAALVPPLRTLLGQVRELLQAGPVTRATLPDTLVADWMAPDGRARIQVFPRGDSNDNAVLRRFSAAVQAVAPQATGAPISIQGAADSIVAAFLEAGLLSGLAIAALLALVLRRLRDVLLTVAPVLLSGLLTLGSCVLLGLPLNFANIIALPLLFGIGVAFNIYFVMAWRQGESGLLASSLARAILFSALTTATAFGSLWLSRHPGTASMGQLLALSLAWVLAATLLLQPALLARPPKQD
ncbi:MMPL family transporter [Roseomonas sp. E05]|uniref:hopanoid transporter HpnN n=1 Tax=Roseomonas sp. E05 TaxID=3046310 RepID=UPI0024B98A07|nr:MMPL family transporter [Roseomonas sp. E05]MDJ0391097.1 MMPL family transporter [Roseomonas sp. E05]